jgi:hypothetical protein
MHEGGLARAVTGCLFTLSPPRARQPDDMATRARDRPPLDMLMSRQQPHPQTAQRDF